MYLISPLFFSASVHLPRIGHDTPAFNWYGTEKLIKKHLASKGIPTLVYPFFSYTLAYLSSLMRKPTICMGENKDADQLRTAKLISALFFATLKVQFLFLLNLKFQASSCLQWLYSPVCVGPVKKPHCRFSH